jgi:hypothetical protein
MQSREPCTPGSKLVDRSSHVVKISGNVKLVKQKYNKSYNS